MGGVHNSALVTWGGGEIRRSWPDCGLEVIEGCRRPIAGGSWLSSFSCVVYV